MTEYTPTTEQVRDGFATDPVAEYNDPITNHTALGRRAFDRWLRAHDAEVAANTLREAANEMDHRLVNGWGDYYGASIVEAIAYDLNARADRIEREATNRKPSNREEDSRA